MLRGSQTAADNNEHKNQHTLQHTTTQHINNRYSHDGEHVSGEPLDLLLHGSLLRATLRGIFLRYGGRGGASRGAGGGVGGGSSGAVGCTLVY